MKKFLEEMLNKNNTKRSTLANALVECESKEERASIQATINELDTEAREIQTKIANLDTFNPVASYKKEEVKRNEVGTDSVEYRTAFMNYVTKNVPIPAELRANTLTTDVASVIPTHLVNQIVEKMDDCGMILPLVTRTSFKAGIVVPTSSVKPVATWVSEGATSNKQKKTTGSITFSYFKLRCEISMSIEVGTMALAVFEAKFVENVAKAMVIAIEKSIINGNGTSQPKGILKETGVSVEVSANPTYAELCSVEAQVKAEYEATSKWFMTKAQFMKFVAMTDQQGQPIARVNYGINGKAERTLLGREVVIHPYAEEMGNLMGAIVDFADYDLNTIYDLGIQKKQDWDTEDLLTKAVMSVDGKMVATESLIKVTLKGA